MARFEWRVRWSAGSNIGFRGESYWQQTQPGEFASPEEVVDWLHDGPGEIPFGLEAVIDLSGLEWSAEVREVTDRA